MTPARSRSLGTARAPGAPGAAATAPERLGRRGGAGAGPAYFGISTLLMM